VSQSGSDGCDCFAVSGGGSSRSPLAVIFKTPFGKGLRRPQASSHGARIQTSHFSAVVRITGGFRIDRSDNVVRFGRQKPVEQVPAFDGVTAGPRSSGKLSEIKEKPPSSRRSKGLKTLGRGWRNCC
jgi:hypothetical protein